MTSLIGRLSPINRRRWANFSANRRGYWSLWIIAALLILSLFAEFIANDRPLLVSFKGEIYVPVLVDYPETRFGGAFETPADYTDAFLRKAIASDGWMIEPLIPYSYRTIDFNIGRPAPSPPDGSSYDARQLNQREDGGCPSQRTTYSLPAGFCAATQRPSGYRRNR